MRRLALSLVWLIYSVRSLVVLLKYFFKKNIIVLDLDNTLIKTANELIKNNKKFSKAFKNAEIRHDFVNAIKSKHPNQSDYIIISARRFNYHNITKKYLKSNKEIDYKFILVPNPLIKYYIYKFIFSKKNTFVYDDLTGGHEDGKIIFYEDIALKINELNKTKLYHSNQIEQIEI